MSSEITVYSRDGSWRADLEAWVNNFWFFKSIGSQATIYRKTGSSVWGGSSWSRANARTIIISNLYNGGLARQDGRWDNQSYAELKHFVFGGSITVPSTFPGGAPVLLTSVEGVINGWFGNGDPFNARVTAGDEIADSSIW